jgi:hypothetical protein
MSPAAATGCNNAHGHFVINLKLDTFKSEDMNHFHHRKLLQTRLLLLLLLQRCCLPAVECDHPHCHSGHPNTGCMQAANEVHAADQYETHSSCCTAKGCGGPAALLRCRTSKETDFLKSGFSKPAWSTSALTLYKIAALQQQVAPLTRCDTGALKLFSVTGTGV